MCSHKVVEIQTPRLWTNAVSPQRWYFSIMESWAYLNVFGSAGSPLLSALSPL